MRAELFLCLPAGLTEQLPQFTTWEVETEHQKIKSMSSWALGQVVQRSGRISVTEAF